MKMLKLAAVAGMTMLLACMALAGCGSSQQQAQSAGSAAQEDDGTMIIGELSYCMENEEVSKKAYVNKMMDASLFFNTESFFVPDDSMKDIFLDLDKINSVEDLQPVLDKMQVKEYDSLTSMLMALRSGEINRMSVYEPVAEYITARNDDVKARLKLNREELKDDSGQPIKEKTNKLLAPAFSDHFAFLMMDKNTELRDDFNKAISEILADGTGEKLAEDYIFAPIDGRDLKAVELPAIEGADTIKVGVTGDMPPFDYISDDGKPAGYNTALLAEIGRRTGKNIELVNIDAGSRTMALSQGTVDVVFWTRCVLSEDELKAFLPGDASDDSIRKEAEANGMDFEKMQKIRKLKEELLSPEDLAKLDLPEGTIRTESYFAAPMVLMEKA